MSQEDMIELLRQAAAEASVKRVIASALRALESEHFPRYEINDNDIIARVIHVG